MGRSSLYANSPRAVRVGLTFLIVNLAWVFFRADDLAAATHYLSSLFNLGGGSSANALLRAGIMCAAVAHAATRDGSFIQSKNSAAAA